MELKVFSAIYKNEKNKKFQKRKQSNVKFVHENKIGTLLCHILNVIIYYVKTM